MQKSKSNHWESYSILKGQILVRLCEPWCTAFDWETSYDFCLNVRMFCLFNQWLCGTQFRESCVLWKQPKTKGANQRGLERKCQIEVLNSMFRLWRNIFCTSQYKYSIDFKTCIILWLADFYPLTWFHFALYITHKVMKPHSLDET